MAVEFHVSARDQDAPLPVKPPSDEGVDFTDAQRVNGDTRTLARLVSPAAAAGALVCIHRK